MIVVTFRDMGDDLMDPARDPFMLQDKLEIDISSEVNRGQQEASAASMLQDVDLFPSNASQTSESEGVISLNTDQQEAAATSIQHNIDVSQASELEDLISPDTNHDQQLASATTMLHDVDLSPSTINESSELENPIPLEGDNNQKEVSAAMLKDVDLSPSIDICPSGIIQSSEMEVDICPDSDNEKKEASMSVLQDVDLSPSVLEDNISAEADHDQVEVSATSLQNDAIDSPPTNVHQSSTLEDIISLEEDHDEKEAFPFSMENKDYSNQDGLPSSHDVSEIRNLPISHQVTENTDLENDDILSPSMAFQRTESIKENPFTRLSESVSRDDEDPSHFEDEDLDSKVVPKVEDVELSKPAEKVKAPTSPMVVSVGTIEVNGSNQYEDINIMSKGSTNNQNEAKPVEKEDSNDNKEFESLRDLRFSSISIYDKPHFEEDIIITVDDAQKHAAESFVSYKVVTKTTRENFLQHEFHVRRRYQDFLWLSNILVQLYPSNIIPPLPQKKMFNKYDPNFLRLRQLALNKFLCRIAEHPILSTSEHFFTFLSAKQVELIEQKKITNIKKFSIPQMPIADPDSPFKTTSEYIDEFGKILSTLSTQSTKLDKEQNELENALNALSPSLALWANSEVCSAICQKNLE